MITVLLYSHLAKQFGRRHRLAISSPAEAIRALCANYKDFRAAIMLHDQPGYRVLVGEEDRADHIGMHLPTGRAKVIKIIPVIAGSGGLGRILLGAALIAASVYLPLPGAGYFEGALSEFSIASTVSSIGFSLVLGGVSQLLFAPPKPANNGSTERANNLPSYNFNGPVNTIGQGNCVPVCYGGPIRVGSQVISAGTETVNL
jgi:predicted phage tail protein